MGEYSYFDEQEEEDVFEFESCMVLAEVGEEDNVGFECRDGDSHSGCRSTRRRLEKGKRDFDEFDR